MKEYFHTSAREFFSLSLIFLLGEINFSSAQTFQWAKMAGTNAANNSSGNNIAVDAQGNNYVVGTFEGTVNFDGWSVTSAGSTDIFIAKYNTNGTIQWVVRAGSTGDDEGADIALNATGDLYITGKFHATATFGNYSLTSSGSADSYIAKYEPTNGNCLWAVKGGSPTDDDVSNAISVDASGNAYITGSFAGTATFGNSSVSTFGASDIYIARCDENGNWLWVVNAGAPSWDKGTGISVEPSGNIYVTGSFSDYYGYPNYFGSNTLYGSGMFLAKYNSSGTNLWVVKGSGADGGDVDADANGNAYTIGTFNISATFTNATSGATTTIDTTSNFYQNYFFAKYDGAGTLQWVQSLGNIGYTAGNGISVNSAGEIYVTGTFQGTTLVGGQTLISSGYANVFVAKFHSDGTLTWATSAQGSYFHIAGGSGNTAGSVYLTGWFAQNVDFGSTCLSGYCDQQYCYTTMFAAKLNDFLHTGIISGSPFCAGTTVNVPYTLTDILFSPGNTITAQLSDASGNFCQPVNIGAINSTSASGVLTATIPANTIAGTNYRIRVMSSSPFTLGADNGVSITIKSSPVADAGDDTTIFVGQSVQIGTMPLPGNIYSWAPVVGLSNPGIANPVASPSITTTYFLYVTSANGCTGNDSVIISVFQVGNTCSTAINLGQGDTCANNITMSDSVMWFRFVADSQRVKITATNLAGNIDSLAVYSGNCNGLIAFDSVKGSNSILFIDKMNFTIGQDYFIRISSSPNITYNLCVENLTSRWKCATDAWLDTMRLRIPGLDSLLNLQENVLRNIMNNPNLLSSGPPYKIPVVVHVVYETNEQYGTGSNINYAQIQSQIAAINAAFNKNYSAYNGQTHGPDAFDAQIEFCLAQLSTPSSIAWGIDPTTGNTEYGVVRHGFSSGHTLLSYDYTTDDQTLVNVTLSGGTDFPYNMYLNIWTVPTISGGIIGFSPIPIGFPSTYVLDGVVVRSNVFGDNTTSVPPALPPFTPVFPLSSQLDQGKSLAHEIGHYLNLYHTFDNTTCPEINCQFNGDYCCDTPPTSTQGPDCFSPTFPTDCNGNSDQNVPNYLSYSDDNCMNTFTQEQANRIYAFINIDPSRTNLVSSVNGVNTGIIGPGGCFPSVLVSNIIANPNPPYCVPATITFSTPTGTGYSATSWNWQFPGGSPTSSTNPSQAVTYNSPGSYQVTLTASNGLNTLQTTISIFISPCTQIQSTQRNWFFGQYAGLNFSSGNPTLDLSAFNNSTINTLEGCATQSDAGGNLLFYTDGVTIWNKSHQKMAPTSHVLTGHSSGSQTAMIVPDPGNPNRYYVFTVPAVENRSTSFFAYSVVDMTLNFGLGEIVSGLLNIPIPLPSGFSSVSEFITSIPSCNGVDYWVIVHNATTSSNSALQKFFVYLVNSGGVFFLNIYSSQSMANYIGSLKASPSGQKLAFAAQYDLRTYDFNNSTGAITNPFFVTGSNARGLSFSPNSSLLYTAEHNWPISSILQYDITVPNPVTTVRTVGTFSESLSWNQLQLGPDGKLYMSLRNLNHISVINSPDSYNQNNVNECVYNFNGPCLNTPCVGTSIASQLGLPNMIDADASKPSPTNPAFSITYLNCSTITCTLDPCWAAYNANWNFGDGSPLVIGSFVTHTYTSNGTFNITLTLNFGTYTVPIVTQQVSVFPVAPTISGPSPVCFGQTPAPNYSVPPGFNFYFWTVTGGTIISGQGTNNITVNWTSVGSGIISVALTGNNCSYNVSLNVTIYPSPSALAGPDQIICPGSSAILGVPPLSATGGTPPYSYFWSPNVNLNNQFIANPIASPTTPVLYNLLVTDANGCSGNDGVQVNIGTNCCTAPVIYLGQLYTSGNNFITDPLAAINGNIIVDGVGTTLVILGSDLLMSPGISITVQNGAALYIANGAHLHACNDMWKGIILKDANSYAAIISGSIIEDAEIALTSINGANYTLDNATFNKNYISVDVQPFGGNHTGTIHKTKFVCWTTSVSGVFALIQKNPYSNQRAHAGVQVTDVNYIEIGSYTGGGSRNLFSYLDFGIYSSGSGINVRNNKFEAIDYSTCPGKCLIGFAVYAIGPATNITVGNFGTGQDNRFDNCWRNIFISTDVNNVLVRRNNMFNTLYSAIEVEQCNNRSGITITHNVINGFNTNGISCTYNSRTPITIERNVIRNSTEGEAIFVGEALPSNTKPVTISKNQILNVRVSVHVVNRVAPTIKDNNGAIGLRFNPGIINPAGYGIWLQQCDRADIVNNDIQGNLSKNTNLYGIKVENSTFVKIIQNSIQNAGNMIYCLGTMNGSNLLCNTMKNYKYGVVLDAVPSGGIGPIGGLTSPSDNQWLTNPVSGGSHTYCINWADGLSIAWFTRNLPTYVPTINTIDGFPSTAVSPNTTATGNTLCYPPDPCIICPSCCRLQQIGGIVNGTITFASGLHNWQAKNYAFRKLHEEPSWLNLGTPEDTAYQQFYSTHQNNNIGKFYEVEILTDSGGTNISQAAAVNNSVNDTSLFEANQKTVNALYLNTIVMGIDTFTSVQEQQLFDIAMQDVRTGGTAVYGARVMLGIWPEQSFAKESETAMSTECTGPNLVPNFDFETVLNCTVVFPQPPLQYYISNWYQPTMGRTDYYNSCMSNSLAQTPSNACGYQIPKSGAGYGSMGRQSPPLNYREYASVKLIGILQAGKRYEVSFNVSVCNKSQFVSDGIGIYLSTDSINTVDSSNLPYIPQIEYPGMITDTANWVLVTGEFVASGGELFVTIGVFYPDSLLNIVQFNPTAGGPWGAYYIDDISVCEIDSSSGITETKPLTQFILYPNPAVSAITLKYDLPLHQNLTFEIWNITGTKIITKTLQGGKQTTSFSIQELSSGIYFYKVFSENKIFVRDKLIIIK